MRFVNTIALFSLAASLTLSTSAYAQTDQKPATPDAQASEENADNADLALPPAPILAVVKASNGTMCNTEEAAGISERHRAYPLTFKYEGELDTDPDRKATLHEVFCMSGAYNIIYVYLLETEEDGIMPIHFAAPAYKAVRESDDYESAVLRIDVTGFSSEAWLVNSEFDPETNQIRSASKARGIGDAGSFGRWSFIHGQFVLTHFEADESFDGESNPIVIYDAVPETP
jgi:hypothetical protein